MTDETRGGAPGAETAKIGVPGAPGRERRMTARRKQEAVLRVLRGEPLEVVARELRVTAADPGAPVVAQLQAKLGEVTMDNELLQEKIDRMESGRPLARRRLKP